MSHKSSLKSKEAKKEHIINKAIEFFSTNGFTGTRIDDITDALGIAKGTFYLYFKSKKELLIDCIGRLTTIVIPKEAWEDIRKEMDFASRHEKRLVAFLKAFPTFCGILNLLKSCIQSNDPVLVRKASDTYKMLVNPLRKDLRWAVEHGMITKVDEEVVSFLMFGMGESVGYLLMIDPRYTLEYVTKIVMDYALKGGQLFQTETMRKSKTENCYWDITNSEGLKIRLKNLRFDEKDYLCGNLGNGEIRVPLRNISSMALHHDGSQISALLLGKDNGKVTIGIDGNVSLTGESEFGQYAVALNQISAISSVLTKDDGDRILDETLKRTSQDHNFLFDKEEKNGR